MSAPSFAEVRALSALAVSLPAAALSGARRTWAMRMRMLCPVDQLDGVGGLEQTQHVALTARRPTSAARARRR
jgi:hypothetical protein